MFALSSADMRTHAIACQVAAMFDIKFPFDESACFFKYFILGYVSSESQPSANLVFKLFKFLADMVDDSFKFHQTLHPTIEGIRSNEFEITPEKHKAAEKILPIIARTLMFKRA